MEKRVIHTELAPAAIGPYSQAIESQRLVFTSGQIGLDPKTGALVTGGFEAQVRQAFANLEAVLKASGASTGHVLKLTLFLTDLGQFATVNAIMQELFTEPYPARSTVGVASLPRAAEFEVEALASL
jgi:reactive intermediate/imine deaminase